MSTLSQFSGAPTPVGGGRLIGADAFARSITFDGGTYLKSGTLVDPADAPAVPLALRHQPGSVWTRLRMPFGPSWSSVAFGNGLFVALSDGDAGTSTDGINWTRQVMPAAIWGGLKFANGLFVALSPLNAVTSPDGVNWTLRALPKEQDWSSVAFGNGLFVAVARSSAIGATSTNGVSWAQQGVQSADWIGLVFGNGLFMSLSSTNVATSPDGVNWTLHALPIAQSYGSIAFGNGLFVVSGADGAVVTSTDGTTWTTREVTSGDVGNIYYTGDRFLAQGSVLISSPDGINWGAQAPVNYTCAGLASNGGTCVFIGGGSSAYLSRASVGIATHAPGLYMRIA